MTVGSSELEIDDNNQEKCNNNNNNRENKNEAQTSCSTGTHHLKISAKNIPAQSPKLKKMGRRKQNCPQKTGVGSVDGKS